MEKETMKIKLNRLLKITVVLVFFVALFFKISYKPALACSCARPLPPLEAKERAAAVFSGTVISQERSPQQRDRFQDIKVNFRVQRVWKGDIGNTVTISTNRSSAACGINFRNRQRYLVYAFDNRNELTTNLCSRTKLLANAREDLRALGPGSSPGQQDISSLNNTNWQLRRLNDRRVRGNITASFTNSRINGNSGCNNYNGSYRQKGNALKFSPLVTTRRACPDRNLQRQENNYLRALRDTYSFEINRNRLIIDYYNGRNEGTLIYRQR